MKYSAQIEPLWHLWISYGTDTVPTQDPSVAITRSWASTKAIPNYTATPGALHFMGNWYCFVK